MILGAAAGRGPSPLRLLAACLGLGCLVILLHLLRPGLLVRLDLAVYDRLAAASPVRPPSGRVTLVEIDERTLAEAGRWPWPRDRVAALLDRVRSLGAAAVGLDLLFAEPDAAGEVSAGPGRPPTVPSGEPPALSTRDAALAAVLARGPFVTGHAFTFDRAVDRPCPLRSIGVAHDERDEMERHPFYGRDVIVRTEERVGVRDDFLLTLAKQIVYAHRERWDGGGYPRACGGRRSPSPEEWSRSWPATTPLASARVYKGALPHAEVVRAIVAEGGTHFDPDMVDTVVRIQEEWRRIAVEFADERDVDHPSAAGHRHEPV